MPHSADPEWLPMTKEYWDTYTIEQKLDKIVTVLGDPKKRGFLSDMDDLITEYSEITNALFESSLVNTKQTETIINQAGGGLLTSLQAVETRIRTLLGPEPWKVLEMPVYPEEVAE